MKPGTGGTGESRVRSQGGEQELGLFERHEPAVLTDYLPGAVEKQVSAFHDSAPQGNSIRGKHGNEIGETQSQVERFAFDCSPASLVTTHSPFADIPRV